MRHFKIIFFAFVFFFLATACKSQKSNSLLIEINENTEMPLKVLVHETYPDSILVDLFIPKEFKLTNDYSTPIKLVDSYLSLKGGNVGSGSIKILKENTLDFGFRKIKINESQSKNFKVYTSYRKYLSKSEKERIFKNAKFSQYMFDDKRKVFDIKKTNDVLQFFKQKIPDTTKGFIRMIFVDYSTDKFFAKNLPVMF